MDPSEHLKKRLDVTPIDEGAASEDSGLAQGIEGIEGLDQAQVAEALKQDPEEVPNRAQEPEPPREEQAGL